jgi:hypothetical protein
MSDASVGNNEIDPSTQELDSLFHGGPRRLRVGQIALGISNSLLVLAEVILDRVLEPVAVDVKQIQLVPFLCEVARCGAANT